MATPAEFEAFAVELLEALRPQFAELAGAAVTEAVSAASRQAWTTGIVEEVRTDVIPPQATVRVPSSGGGAVKVYAQCMVAIPEIGAVVGVMFVPPAGALTWPVAELPPEE